MSGNLATIGMMFLYLIIACNYKKIYLNATRDETFKYLKTYRTLIIISSVLCVVSGIFLLYITNVQHNSTLSEIGFDAFIISALLSVYSLYYLTDEEKFPNLNKKLTNVARKGLRYMFFLLILKLTITLIILAVY